MIRSKLGSFWRFLKQEVIPFVFGLLFTLAFLSFVFLMAYCIVCGYMALIGDVDFLPPLSVLLEGMSP